MATLLESVVLVLVALSGTHGRCKSGFEDIGKITIELEDQLPYVISAAKRTCDHCRDCPDCFNDVIHALKHDIDEFRREWYNIVEVALDSNCAFHDPTVLVGGTSTDAMFIFPDASTSTIPVSSISGMDFDLMTGQLIFNTMFKLFDTDLDGAPQNEIGDFDPSIIVSPEIDGNQVFFGIMDGGIHRYTSSQTEEIITTAENSGRGVHGITLDIIERHIYWTTVTPMDTIYRATMAGSGIHPIRTDARDIFTVAFDQFSRTLYYTTVTGSELVKYNVITSIASDLATLPMNNVDMSVCLESIFISYNANAFYEEYDSAGTKLFTSTPTAENNDFYAIATCNL